MAVDKESVSISSGACPAAMKIHMGDCTMEIPEYVSKDEVRRVCKDLGFRDWSRLKRPTVSAKEASIILDAVNKMGMKVSLEDFRQGLEVELEHGTRYEDANVTNNHPILTGRIVLAHLKETVDYYKRLEVTEIEGDLLKAIMSKNMTKIRSKYGKLVEAQNLLNRAVSDQLR